MVNFTQINGLSYVQKTDEVNTSGQNGFSPQKNIRDYIRSLEHSVRPSCRLGTDSRENTLTMLSPTLT